MQIQLPNDPKLETRASAAGFSSVEDYVRELVERDAQIDASRNGGSATEPNRPDGVSYEEWKQRVRDLAGGGPAISPDFDDSRESLYPDRW